MWPLNMQFSPFSSPQVALRLVNFSYSNLLVCQRDYKVPPNKNILDVPAIIF